MAQGEEFKTTIKVTLQELYRCRGIDGFDDMLEDKLGYFFFNADWKIVAHEDDAISLEVTGNKEEFED